MEITFPAANQKCGDREDFERPASINTQKLTAFSLQPKQPEQLFLI
jgi:hypothetical protein